MPLSWCSVPRCSYPGVRRNGACLLCNKSFCAAHLASAKQHSCPDINADEDEWLAASANARRAEIFQLISHINVNALCKRASALHQGIACTVPRLVSDDMNDLMGGMNYHIPITFDDGVVWLCRIRRQNVSSPPVDVQNKILLSEAATLRYLAATSIPVPKVYDYRTLSPDNPVGVGYILMEKLPGRPLEWNELESEADKSKVLDQFADIFAELDRHTFLEIGCLKHPNDLKIGPFVSENDAKFDTRDSFQSLGPFNTMHSYRVATIQHQMDMIVTGEIYPDNAVDAYLIHLYTLSHIHSTLALQDRDGGNKFYLKHVDDKGDHILVDNALNITGVIDWEWAQTTCKADAFAAPLFLVDVEAYYDGLNELSADEELFARILEEKGRPELSACVRGGRVEHRMMSCVRADNGDPGSTASLFWGLRQALGDAHLANWDSWRKTALEQYKNNNGLRLLQGAARNQS